jgi:hypothetical protein
MEHGTNTSLAHRISLLRRDVVAKFGSALWIGWVAVGSGDSDARFVKQRRSSAAFGQRPRFEYAT